MATLVSQIREMIDALAIVDPEAALEFRGDPSNRLIRTGRAEVDMSGMNVYIPTQKAAPKAKKETQKVAARVSSEPSGIVRLPEVNPLLIDPMNDSLIKGIIYSEILGKPVSLRRYRGRA
jgi:hypothetical protein